MSNSWFRFKNFTVWQDQTAMKICTDSCLFGAWAASKLINGNAGKRILDIGTGTGLLSLMTAQKSSAMIDAVEIDAAAARQADANFELSDYRDRLQVFHTDIRLFEPGYRYDFVIANPPFFEDNLKSPEYSRNLALHSVRLSLTELIQHTARLLDEHGSVAALLPYQRTEYFLRELHKQDLYPLEHVMVRQTEKHEHFRSMLLIGKVEAKTLTSEITIKENGEYSPLFTQLLRDYYLFL